MEVPIEEFLCPFCLQPTLRIEMRSRAGQFLGHLPDDLRLVPFLVCTSCGTEAEGKIDK